MSSTTSRPTYPDRRHNGTARPRMSAQDSVRSDRSDPRYRDTASPQPGYPGTSHKRTASGNPRPAGRTTAAATEERRTEKTHVTTREVLVSRTRSPERRSAAPAPKDKARAADTPKARPAETRARESKEVAPQGVLCIIIADMSAPSCCSMLIL